MNNTEADELIFSGQWSDLIQDIIEAMRRYRDEGHIKKHGALYNRYSERIAHLKDALEV